MVKIIGNGYNHNDNIFEGQVGDDKEIFPVHGNNIMKGNCHIFSIEHSSPLLAKIVIL